MNPWWTLPAVLCGVALGLGPAGIADLFLRVARWWAGDPHDSVTLTDERRRFLMDASRRQDLER